MEKGGDHDHGEDEHAQRLEPSPSDRVRVVVAAGDEFGRCPYDRGAEKVKGGVDQGGEDGERACENDDGDLPRE